MVKGLQSILGSTGNGSGSGRIGGRSLYMVADGVKFPMLWSELEDGMLEYDNLFREESLRRELERVAPFLIELDFESETKREQSVELLKCYGKNGAVFFASSLSFYDALSKVRDIFYLYDDEGNLEGVLRFYEPRVFEVLIEKHHEVFRELLFDEIDCYWCEKRENENVVVKYQYAEDGIRCSEIGLKEGENV